MIRIPNQRAANVAYYARNREREIQRVQVRQAETVSFLRHLRDRPCMDCGLLFLPYQMDFDHRDPMEKRYTVTRMVGRAGIGRIFGGGRQMRYCLRQVSSASYV